MHVQNVGSGLLSKGVRNGHPCNFEQSAETGNADERSRSISAARWCKQLPGPANKVPLEVAGVGLLKKTCHS